MFLAISLSLTFCDGYKILVTTPMSGKSHFLYMQSFVKAFIARGHDVTFLTSYSLKNEKLANYTEVLIDPPFDFSIGK